MPKEKKGFSVFVWEWGAKQMAVLMYQKLNQDLNKFQTY